MPTYCFLPGWLIFKNNSRLLCVICVCAFIMSSFNIKVGHRLIMLNATLLIRAAFDGFMLIHTSQCSQYNNTYTQHIPVTYYKDKNHISRNVTAPTISTGKETWAESRERSFLQHWVSSSHHTIGRLQPEAEKLYNLCHWIKKYLNNIWFTAFLILLLFYINYGHAICTFC